MLGFAGSSLDGKGEVKAFRIDNGEDVWKVAMPETGVYALACSPDGKKLAVSGLTARSGFFSVLSGEISKTFVPVPIEKSAPSPVAGKVQAKPDPEPKLVAEESLPKQFTVQSLVSFPSELKVSRALDYGQLILVAKLQGGEQAGVTRMTEWVVKGGVGQVSNRGLFTPSQNGSGKIIGEFSGHRLEIPVEVKGLEVSYEPDFIHDVNPIITKLGCNSGTCHGSKDGREGFKLSLRGYDAIYDASLHG